MSQRSNIFVGFIILNPDNPEDERDHYHCTLTINWDDEESTIDNIRHSFIGKMLDCAEKTTDDLFHASCVVIPDDMIRKQLRFEAGLN